MSKIAFITGITGQDGSYLAEFLLEKGYHVHGMIRRSSTINTQRLEHIFKNENLYLHYGDLTDFTSLYTCLINIKNRYNDINKFEIYNLGAQSHVKISFDVPTYTANTDANGTLNLLEAVRLSELGNKIRFYQASTSEMFGLVQEVPQRETTPFYPRSPYGVAKLYAHWIVKNYRESYGLFACNGILFNHESERRGHNFVTRKITLGLNKIMNEPTEILTMGNIDSLRDWGHALDYIEGMWLMLQQDEADDFVLATGEMHSVREFIEIAFKMRGFDIEWSGQGTDEIGTDRKSGRILVRIDEKYFRPAEVDKLLGDSTKARTRLGWTPKITFDNLVKLMVDNDCITI
uniref:GDP-mannose 4,6-dehydratase n=1 Tax=viral metagenome TaxID=1070528 RepID=A0A6C0B920_9ZZZZ